MTNNPNSLISKPEWLRVKAPQVERIGNTTNLLNDLNLNTVKKQAVQILANVLLVELQLSS